MADDEQTQQASGGLAELEALFAAGMSGGLAERPDYIGGGFSGPAGPLSPAGQFLGPYAQQTPDSVGDGYYEGDDLAVLTRMNTEQLARFQDTAVALGLTSQVIPGRLDDNTVGAMQTLMALGNRQAVTWQSVLDGIQRSGGLVEPEEKPEFEPQPFLKPDYATIAQDIKALFRQRLGHDPDQYEMEQLAGEMTGFYRMDHEAQTEFDRLVHEQTVEEGVQPAGEVQSVDPVSRFMEQFEQRYQHELDFVEDKKDAQETGALVREGVSTLSQMSAGGA